MVDCLHKLADKGDPGKSSAHQARSDSQHAQSAPAALTCCTQQPCSQLRQLLWQVLLHQQLSSRDLLAQAQRQLEHLQQPIQVGLL